MPTQTQGAPAPRSTLRARVGALGFGEWLLLILFVICFAAAATGGGIALTPAGRIEVATAAAGLLCAFGISAGGVEVPRARAAWAGVGLIFAYAVWCAISINWSIEPDASWLVANRTLAYAIAAGVVLVAASSTRASSQRIAVGIGVLGVTIALFALAGKLLPGIDLGPVNLDFGGRFSRLSHPFDYWNALALMCVMTAAPFIWVTADPDRPIGRRVPALLALQLLLLTMVLTYSRGAIFSFAAMLVVMVAAGPDRLGRLAAAGGALAGMLPVIVVAFTQHDLSADNLPLSDRINGGLVLLAVLALCLAGSALVARAALRRNRGGQLSPRARRGVWRGLGVAAGAVVLVAILAVALSSRGLTGEISHQVDQFRHPGSSTSNTPSRLVSTTSSSRYEWWQEALGAFSDEPIRGQGAGSFPTIHYLYRKYETPVSSSHSLPLMLLSETGLVGFGLGAAALLLLFAAAITRARWAVGAERAARIAMLAAASAWLIGSFYDWFWEIPGVTLTALVALCAAAAPPFGEPAAQQPRRERPERSGAVPALVLSVVAAIAVAVAAWLPVLSEQKRVDALAKAGEKGGLSDAADEADLAHRLDPLSVDPLFTEASIETARGRPNHALELYAQAAATQPENRRAWLQLFPAYADAGFTEQYAEALQQYLRTDPLAANSTRPVTLVTLADYPPALSPTAAGTPPPPSQ